LQTQQQGGRARWQIRSIHCFDFIKKKNWVKQERKRGRTSGITKEVSEKQGETETTE
jgi:hypothetical protein